MEQLNHIFIHYPEYRIIICKQCQSAIIPAHVKTHLSKNHSEFMPKIRNEINQVAQNITGLAQTKDDIIYPPASSAPVPHLPVWTDGFKCTTPKEDGTPCGHIQRRKKNIQAHNRVVHGWINPQQSSHHIRKDKQHDVPWVANIHCQQFFKTGGFQKLFEVEAEQERINEDEMEMSQLVITQAEQDFQSSWAEVEKEKETKTVDGEISRYEPNAWLNRAGWAKHLAGIERQWLMSLTWGPRDEEKGLFQACRAVERLIFKAQKASQAGVVGWPAINYINRREFGGDSNEKPFYTQQIAKTIVKYARIWIQIFCYVCRSESYNATKIQRQQEENEEEEETEESSSSEKKNQENQAIKDKKRKPGYRLTTEQKTRFERIQELVGQDAGNDDSGSSSSDSDDGWNFNGQAGRSSHGGRNGQNRNNGSDDSGSEEEEWEDERADELDRRMLDFFMAVLDHDVKDSEYTNVLVSGLAVLGLDGERGWMSALGYTPKLSAVVTVAKMLVLYKAKTRREAMVEWLVNEDGRSPEHANDQAPSHFDLVKEMAGRFMGLTSTGDTSRPGPIDYVLRLRTYGMKIRYNTTADGVIDWVGEKVLFGHISFTMSELRSTVHGLVEVTRSELYKELLLLDVDSQGALTADGSARLPPIHWADLVDNPAELATGWSVFKDSRNQFMVEGKSWLYTRIFQEARLREEFIRSQQQAAGSQQQRPWEWVAARIRKYRQQLRLFREHLLVLVHMTGGQPGRTTELLSLQHSNTENGTIRCVFVEDGLMAVVTGYHKGFGLSGNVKIVHRYLPKEVGELLFYYLWLVEPFWQTMKVVCGGARNEASPFIWEPKTEPQKQKRQKKKRKKPHGSRQTRRGQTDDDNDDKDNGNDDDNDNNNDTNRSQRDLPIREIFTNEPTWNTDKVRQALNRVTLEWMGIKISIMAWRHISIGIFRRFIRDGAVNKMINEGGEDEEKEEDEFFDLQAGHGSNTAGMIYARGLTESPFHTASRRAGFRKVSEAWHRFLMFQSTLSLSSLSSRKAEVKRMTREVIEEQFRRWRQLREIDIEQQLRALVGEESRFRGIQEPALKAIMRQKSPIVGIMGTGGGKSLLFMLPAGCSTGVTVVVVPLISLREDLKRRCRKIGIECVEWSSRKPNEWASIVLVTPESAVSESFGNFINRQRAMGRLDRIVVDECHVVLDSQSGWRTRMLGLRDLVKTETQMVYLTATLPPREEGEFIRLMGLSRKEEELDGEDRKLWFRGSTTRKNVEYQAFNYDRKEEEETVRRLVEIKKQEYPMPGQVIVYCDTVKKTEKMAEILGSVCFHRNVGSIGEKAEILRQLTEGRQQVFTATNALGLGVDAPTIRVVIHVGRVRKLRDYAQESGRAGRDGLKSEAIILQGVSYNRRGEVIEEDISSWMEDDMHEFIMTEECRRVVIDRVMDGREDRAGCEEDEEKCDNCRERERSRIAVERDRKDGEEQGREEEEEGEGREEGVSTTTLEETDIDVGIDTQVGEPAEESGRETERQRRETEQMKIQKVVGGELRVEFEREMQWRRQMGREEIDRQKEALHYGEKLEDILEEWSTGCVLCHGYGYDGHEGHRTERCTRMSVEWFWEKKQEIEEGIEWAKWSGCLECRVPQGICQRWRDSSRGWGWERSGGDCQYKDVVIGMVTAIWTIQREKAEDWVMQSMVREGSITERERGNISEERMLKWLGRKVRIGGLEASKACEMIIQIG